MTYLLVFSACWVLFALFGQKKRFHELYPTSLIGMLMSLTSDVVTSFYPFWTYHADDNYISPFIIKLLDDFGIYPIIAYFYIQFLPSSLWKWFLYTIIWTSGGIGVEYILIHQGYMAYHRGWSFWTSYAADWVIFIILSSHHIWHTRQSHRRAAKGTAGDIYEQSMGVRCEWLKSVFMDAPDGIVIFNRHARIIDVNPAFEQMVGWQKDELIGQEHPLTPEDELEFTMKCFDDVVDGVVSFARYNGKKRTKTGGYVEISATLVPIKDERNRIIAVFGVANQIQTHSTEKGLA